MSLAELSIKRPVFVSCLTILLLVVGLISIKKMPVNFMPDTEMPMVTIYTAYPGAAPNEVETLVTKEIEKELSGLADLKTLESTSSEGLSIVRTEFNFDVDMKDVRQRVKDKISNIKNQLPDDAKEPYVWVVDTQAQPILYVALVGNKDVNELYDLADGDIKNKFEQVKNVGLVEVWGGRKTEYVVNLSREKLKNYDLSASQVAAQLSLGGENTPVGKYSKSGKEFLLRTLGEYNTIQDINHTIVSFRGSDVPVKLQEVANVEKQLAEQRHKVYIDKHRAVFLPIYKQSGTNTVDVARNIKKALPLLNEELKRIDDTLELKVVKDDSKIIKANVQDVKETIFIGIFLTILVVFFFLGNFRSTVITGLSLPTSLLGAFALMHFAGFSINIMTLLALSLAVGLLIDDAIVVRENIFRHIQNGTNPATAALHGTREVTLAVIGTSLTILAVFGPVGFLHGVVGQFFKEFGLTICFAMLISLFDALTLAPMLSCHFAGKMKSKQEMQSDYSSKSKLEKILYSVVVFQDWLEKKYVGVLNFSLKNPLKIIMASIVIFISSIMVIPYLKSTFLPAQDHGEFNLTYELEEGTELDVTDKLSMEITDVLLAIPEIDNVLTTVGSGGPNSSRAYVTLVNDSERSHNTTEVKDIVREKLKPFKYANPLISDVDMVGVGMRPFNVNVSGKNSKLVDEVADKLFNHLKTHPGLVGVDTSSREGKPEIQVKLDHEKAEALGITSKKLGAELRTQIEGNTSAVLRTDGQEYDITVKIDSNEKNIKENFEEIYIPNINGNLIKLSSFASLVETIGPASIKRVNREKYIGISADMAPDGTGMAKVMDDIKQFFVDNNIPPEIKYDFVGQSESYGELLENIVIALSLGILFIYLVLASLYESFIVPITIMLVIPLALVGAFYGLLITNSSLDMFSMIGCILLMGLATKNSILLVDYANQKLQQGYNRTEAILEAGVTRLRPILMTTVALIAGMLPVAYGINEASKQRTSMGIAIIGGLISSTLLTLVVIPAAFSYIDRMRLWGRKKLGLAEINKKIHN